MTAMRQGYDTYRMLYFMDRKDDEEFKLKVVPAMELFYFGVSAGFEDTNKIPFFIFDIPPAVKQKLEQVNSVMHGWLSQAQKASSKGKTGFSSFLDAASFDDIMTNLFDPYNEIQAMTCTFFYAEGSGIHGTPELITKEWQDNVEATIRRNKEAKREGRKSIPADEYEKNTAERYPDSSLIYPLLSKTNATLVNFVPVHEAVVTSIFELCEKIEVWNVSQTQ